MSGSTKQSRQNQSIQTPQDPSPFTIIEALHDTPDNNKRHHPNHHHNHHHSSHSHSHHPHTHNTHNGHNAHNTHTHHHSGHRNDAERMRKKFRDAIYVGNFERVARIIKNIIENDTLDLSSVLLPYASRHVTPIGLAARRGHVKICKVLVEVIKEYVIKQHYNQHIHANNPEERHFVPGPMLDILSKEDDAKDKEKSGEDEEEQEEVEVEENALNGGDESSSEQHNNTQSISPQPNCSNPPMVSLNAIHNGAHDEGETYILEPLEPAAIELKTPTENKTKNKKNKHKQHMVRSSSSGALIDDHQGEAYHHHTPEPMHEIEQDSKTVENELMLHKHRKTRSLPYIHLHSMLNRLDGENRTALSHACEKGQREVIEFLLSEPGIAIEAGGKHHEESWTNLHWACRYGHDQIVQLLLDHNANINAQTSKKKSTGLHLACATGHTEVIHVLLQNGAAKEIEDVYGCSPLSLAIHFGEKKVQQILYEAGIDVSAHDARRLKKDNHIFRRFGWIKIPPSISTNVVLPDDVWCVVCGFLPCDELLLNVRLISFGFLYVVHHPALRKLVNFKRSLPDKVDELVQYNENHQTLVLKAPSPENNFNVNAAPFAFMAPPMHPMVGVGGVPFAPPPPPAAAILGGIPPHVHPHPPHTHLTIANHHAPNQHPPNPFGNFPHFMIPAPHHPHGTANNINNNLINNGNGNTIQLQSSLPPPPPPPTLQSMYNNRQSMTRPQSNSLPSVPRHSHRSFQSIDFVDAPGNDPNDEFTPPPIQATVHTTQSDNRALYSLINHTETNNTLTNDHINNINITVTSLPQSQSDLTNIIHFDDNEEDRNKTGQEEDEKSDEVQLNSQLENMNGQIASLIFDQIAPVGTVIEQKQERLTTDINPAPIPSDINGVVTIQPQSSDSLDNNTNNVSERPAPILTCQALNNHRNRWINLQTIHSSISHPTSNTLPANHTNTNTNNTLSLNQLTRQIGGSPPLLSRNYSHNNFVEQNQEFQRFMSVSPPMSPSMAQHRSNNQSQLPSRNLAMPHLLQFTPTAGVASIASIATDDISNISINLRAAHSNEDGQHIFNITPWNGNDMMAINNPMLNSGAYGLNRLDAMDDNKDGMDDEDKTQQDVEEDKKQEDVDDNTNSEETDVAVKWQYKHCRWLACAVNFGPSNLRKIRLTGTHILTQPLIRVLSCLSFIVHLELAHFHAYKLVTMDLKHLQRVSQLKMIRQLKVFPVIRNNSYISAKYDAVAVATFITQIGSTALTLGIKYEAIDISEKEEEDIRNAMNERQIAYHHDEETQDNATQDKATTTATTTDDVDMATLSSLTWKSLFDHLPSNLRSLRLHFGKDDSLKSGAVDGLKNFESIKCFTLHGDPGLYGQIKEWSDVFQRWNKLRYIVLGHRNNTKELQVPKEILQALPPMLPELALNISVHSIPNVVWYLKHVVKAECFLRINLHVVHKHKSDLYHASIHSEIIPCLTRFHNLETAYLKCGMVTLEQIELLLQNCTKVSFVGFGINAEDEKQVVSFRILLEDYGFDKIVVKGKLNWLIAVKSYDKLLLDPTRCIHPVLEAFDDKSCQIMQPLKMKQKPKMIMPHNKHLEPL